MPFEQSGYGSMLHHSIINPEPSGRAIWATDLSYSQEAAFLGVGVGSPIKNNRGACWEFLKESSRGINILFCGSGLKFLSPLRDTSSDITKGSIP